MQKPIPISSTVVHRGRIIEVSTERLHYGPGREFDLDFVKHPGAAAVVAIDDSDRVCLVRQYRHGIGDFLWEIPAGKLDAGEAPQICAVRELAEETGVNAKRWASLGQFYPAPGIFTEIIHLFLASELDVGAAAPDADEELEIQWLPFTAAVEMVLRGELNDGKTAMALWRAQHRRQL
ncbi:MAG TPA: NUDIX hydrolase [Steroidobacteraceae bacterium]